MIVADGGNKRTAYHREMSCPPSSSTSTQTGFRAITGCLKPTNLEDLYLLSGIAPPSPTLCTGKFQQRRWKSRNCFIHSVKHTHFPPKVIRCSEWLRRTNKTPHRTSCQTDLGRGHEAHGQRGSVVFLPRPMEGMGRLKFLDLFTELPVPPQAAGVVGTFLMCFYI